MTLPIPSFGTPATGNLERTDLYQIHHVVQNTLMAYPKDLIISIFRNEFAKDSYYHYVQDQFGFPKVTDHTDLPLDAGYENDETTRIFIGEPWRFDAILYPAILVKVSSARSVPISINRNKHTVEYEKQLYVDGYGNEKIVFVPKYFDLAGVWEGTIQIDIHDRDSLSRDNLVGLVGLMLADIKWEELRKAGLTLKPPALSGISETEDRQQEKLYKATISVDYRSEWRRLIPVERTVDQINFCVDFRAIGSDVANPNLEINGSVSLLDQIETL